MSVGRQPGKPGVFSLPSGNSRFADYSWVTPGFKIRARKCFIRCANAVVCSMHDAVSLCRPKPPTAADDDRPRPGPSTLPVADWLAAFSMDLNAEHLERAGYHSSAADPLQRHDLVALGITLQAGHRKKKIPTGAAAAAVTKSPTRSLQSRHSASFV